MAKKGLNKPLAKIYAEALYATGHEQGKLAQVREEIESLQAMLEKEEKIGRFLETPTIVFAEKRRVLDGLLKGFSTITRNFLLVLIERNRAALLGQIVDEFIAHTDRIAGVAKVDVRSARPLEAAEKTRLQAVLEQKLGRRVQLNEAVRPELLGGLVLVHEDKMWDASVAHSLRKLEDQMDSLKLTTIKWSE